MSLENTGLMLKQARKAGYCIGAFNIVDYLTIEAVVKAAVQEQAPVIIQTSPGTVQHYGAQTLVGMVRLLAVECPIPVGLHLDHGTDPTMILECIQAGYTSVMIDASQFPFDENVARTHAVVEIAHRHQVAVEGEIGILEGIEDDLVVDHDKAIYTTPEEAIAFQAASGVDFLAVAIGTAHGFYKTAPRLDIQTLRVLRDTTDFPLVVHGGTGLSFEVIRELVSAGASKMNISTILKKTYIDSNYDYLSQYPGEYNPLKMIHQTSKHLVEVIKSYLRVFNSSNRANQNGK